MRVDIAEHTLSLEVKKAMAEIPELKDISQGTQVGNIVYMYLIALLHSLIHPHIISYLFTTQICIEASHIVESNMHFLS